MERDRSSFQHLITGDNEEDNKALNLLRKENERFLCMINTQKSSKSPKSSVSSKSVSSNSISSKSKSVSSYQDDGVSFRIKKLPSNNKLKAKINSSNRDDEELTPLSKRASLEKMNELKEKSVEMKSKNSFNDESSLKDNRIETNPLIPTLKMSLKKFYEVEKLCSSFPEKSKNTEENAKNKKNIDEFAKPSPKRFFDIYKIDKEKEPPQHSLNSLRKSPEDVNKSLNVTNNNNNKSLCPEKATFIRSLNERIFWTKDKLDDLWERFKLTANKIKIKIIDDFDKLHDAIKADDDTYVLDTMLNKEFQEYYRIELAKNKVLEFMLVKNKPNLLMKVLNDKFYNFNNLYVFEFLKKLLSLNKSECRPLFCSIKEIKGIELEKYEEVLINDVHDKQVNDVLTNVIDCELYSKSPDLVRIFAWFLANFENYKAFLLLVERNSSIFVEDKEIFNNFASEIEINNFCNSEESYEKVVSTCLKEKLEDLAIALLDYRREMKDKNIIKMAVETNSVAFLQFIWEQTHKQNDEVKRGSFSLKNMYNSSAASSKRKSILVYRSLKINSYNLNRGDQIFTLSHLIQQFKELGNVSAVNKIILEWAHIDKDPELLKALFVNNCFSQVSTLIWKKKIFWSFTGEEFKKTIEFEQVELILHFLKLRHCIAILSEVDLQKIIVNKYMSFGSKMYYGAEMLTYIYKANWDETLTKSLCKNIIKVIKTKDILNCHSPILTCLILCEFLNETGSISIQNATRCQKVVTELMQFCKNIQISNPDENYIRFLMTQKDSRGRSCLQIASENSYYQVLESAEIGTIVKKMWNGSISNNGFFAASSLNRYLDSDVKAIDLYSSFEHLDTKKVYFYQLEVWTDSCSLRYWPESLSTVLLIVVYNLFIYFLVRKGQMLNSINELEASLRTMLFSYILWTSCIILNLILGVLFSVNTKRKFKLDVWTWSEIFMFIFSLLLLIDTKEIFGQYHVNDVIFFADSLLNELNIPFTKYLNTQPVSYSGTFAFIVKAALLSINDLLVWLRITGILLTFKEIGPTIRMIYLMGILLLKYVLIIILFMACCAAIFTALFHVHSAQFKDFSTSVMSLFAGFVGSFDTNTFEEDYKWVGAIMVMGYVCIAGILLINLLIALLSNVYEKMSLVVDASNRSVLISYYRRYKWNKYYGHLIFLTTPLSAINYITLLFSIFVHKDKRETFNKLVCRIYYLIFYFPVFIFIYMIYSLALIPLCYIKGILKTISNQNDLKLMKVFKILNILKWIAGGLFFLSYVYFRDIYLILSTIFNENIPVSTDTNRIKSYITADEVFIFLKFIHKRKPDKPHDIHSLFMDYLEYEQRQKAKDDDNLREKKVYLHKLNSAVVHSVKQKTNGKTVVIYNNLKSNITSNYIKKNLIIIEILENFLIDQESDSIIVDLEKLKTLLPKTMNINNAYIKRLIYTDVHALNKAVNKLKMKKNVFLQYQLLNKIVSSAIRLDKQIDHEITKNLRRKCNKRKITEEKDQEDKKSVSEREEEGNEFEYMQELNDLLELITNDIKETTELKKRTDRITGEVSNYKKEVTPRGSYFNKSENKTLISVDKAEKTNERDYKQTINTNDNGSNCHEKDNKVPVNIEIEVDTNFVDFEEDDKNEFECLKENLNKEEKLILPDPDPNFKLISPTQNGIEKFLSKELGIIYENNKEELNTIAYDEINDDRIKSKKSQNNSAKNLKSFEQIDEE